MDLKIIIGYNGANGAFDIIFMAQKRGVALCKHPLFNMHVFICLIFDVIVRSSAKLILCLLDLIYIYIY